MVKVFPVNSMGGVSYLKAIKSVYPNIEIVPTGGVNLANFNDYLTAGVFAVGMGSDLTIGNLRDVTRRCQNVLKESRKSTFSGIRKANAIYIKSSILNLLREKPLTQNKVKNIAV